jgi:hypothetical protein
LKVVLAKDSKLQKIPSCKSFKPEFLLPGHSLFLEFWTYLKFLIFLEFLTF